MIQFKDVFKSKYKKNKKGGKFGKIAFFKNINRQEFFFVVLGVLIIVFSLIFLKPALENYFYANLIDFDDLIADNYKQVDELLENYGPIRNWSIDEPNVDARAISATEVHPDGTTKTLLAKNADHPYPIASISKLMTAMVAVDLYDLEEKLIVSLPAAGQINAEPLREGDSLRVKDLLYLILMESSNGAAYALAEIEGVSSFVREMNNKAEELGLDQTFFVTPSGLTSADQRDNYSTANELTRMLIYLWKQPEYEIIREILVTEDYAIYDGTGAFYYRAINNNQLIGYYHGFAGGKTGYLPLAGECLVSVLKRKDEDTYLIVVVLGSKDRFEDTKKIVDWLSRSYLYSFDYGY